MLDAAPTALGHRLDMDGVRVRYGQTLAVRDVTLSVAPGEILALLGLRQDDAAAHGGRLHPGRGRPGAGGWPRH
jgi:ABC-type phosphonate transport system ATPase subunit